MDLGHTCNRNITTFLLQFLLELIMSFAAILLPTTMGQTADKTLANSRRSVVQHVCAAQTHTSTSSLLVRAGFSFAPLLHSMCPPAKSLTSGNAFGALHVHLSTCCVCSCSSCPHLQQMPRLQTPRPQANPSQQELQPRPRLQQQSRLEQQRNKPMAPTWQRQKQSLRQHLSPAAC